MQATKLEGDIKNAVVISASEVPKDSISVGSKVKLKDKASQDIFVFTIMDQRDADVDNTVSFTSRFSLYLPKRRYL